MTLVNYLNSLNACSPAINWVVENNYETLEDAWTVAIAEIGCCG